MALTAFSGRKPSQMEGELTGFIALLQRYGVKKYLEIGSREGDTFVEIISSLGTGVKGVAVDLPGGKWGHVKTKTKLDEAIQHLQGNGFNVSALYGDSHTDATRRIVVGRGPYDAMLIDGDHTYEGVSQDFKQYHHLAPIIAFHDIVGDGCSCKRSGAWVQVPRFWKDLKAQYTSRYDFFEFVDEGSLMGIGVMIRKSDAQ